MEMVIVNNIIEKFSELRYELEQADLEDYFEELISAIESDSAEDILNLKKILDNDQLEFLKDFNYQFYCLIIK